MAKTRLLKHDFFLNEDLAALPPLTRLFFIGLWVLADREGRLEYRPGKLKAQLFPYHEANVERIVAELSGGFLVKYTAGGMEYLQVKNFKKHQHIHPDEKISVLPAPPLESPEIPGNPQRSQEIMHNNTYTYTYPTTYPSTTTPRKSAVFDEGAFNSFWAEYPNKTAKQAAIKAWKKIAPKDDLLVKIIGGLKRYSQSVDGKDKQYIAHPASWLNGRRWEDEISLSGKSTSSIKAPEGKYDGLGKDYSRPALDEPHIQSADEMF